MDIDANFHWPFSPLPPHMQWNSQQKRETEYIETEKEKFSFKQKIAKFLNFST